MITNFYNVSTGDASITAGYIELLLTHCSALMNMFLTFVVKLQSVTKIVRLAPQATLFNVGCKFVWSFLTTTAWHSFSRL